MSEYIIEIPDEYFPSYDMERTAYYPDERDSAMPLTSFVRCRDCIYYKPDPDPIDPGWPMMCERTGDDMVEPYGYCAWGERKGE